MSGAPPYDAFLLVSFGGPEGMADVMPFLDQVLRGRSVPPERKREVARHYERFGGVSPLNAQNRALIEALRRSSRHTAPASPSTGATGTGIRSWRTRSGRWRGTVSGGRSPSSRPRTARTRGAASISRTSPAPGPRWVRRLRLSTSCAPSTTTRGSSKRTPTGCAWRSPRCRRLAARRRGSRSPRTASRRRWRRGATTSRQLRETCALVAAAVPHEHWALVYQSRSGAREQPWLEPDILAHLETLEADGVADVVVAPVGFVSDHMEIVYDLDTEARERAADLGLGFVRAGTAGTHPAFVRMIRELVEERVGGGERRALGARGPRADVCASDCCPSGAPRPPVRPGDASAG